MQDNTTREIPLTKGKVALVSSQDFERVSRFKWHAHSSKSANKTLWYARRLVSYYDEQGKWRQRAVYLHRFIVEAPSDKQVDHKDTDGLNCQRDNLRVATRSQNHQNMRVSSRSTIGYKGVRYAKKSAANPFSAQIKADGNYRILGYFPNAIAAAQAYDKVARELFGEFARLNFPIQEEQDALK